MSKDKHNKKRYKDLDKQTKFHSNELKKIGRDKTKILKEDGYMEKSHLMLWVLILVIIAVAVLWFFFVR